MVRRSGIMHRNFWEVLFLLSLFLVVVSMPSLAFSAPLPDVEILNKIEMNQYKLNCPGRLAVGQNGTLYITDGSKNRVLKCDRKGKHLGNISSKKATAVAVAPDGTLYVGSEHDGSVAIYSGDTVSGYLGSGGGEFVNITDIAVDKDTGNVYVADTRKGVVKGYDSAGNFLLEIGGLKYPMSVDVMGGKIYVLDSPEAIGSDGYYTTSPQISVYGAGGDLERRFSDSGVNGGNMYSPTDIALDSNGDIYVSDALLKKVFVYDNAGTFKGEIENSSDKINTAVSLAVAPDNRLLVSSNKTRSVYQFGLSGYVFMEASPLSLSYMGQMGAGNPAAQPVTISNSGSGDLTYTATPSAGWMQMDVPSGTVMSKGSMDMNVSVDMTGLASGNHTGSVTITDNSGASEVVTVSLEILPEPSMTVTPQSLAFNTLYGEGNPSPQNITIQIDNDPNGVIAWMGSNDSSWLSISPMSGTGDAMTQSTVSVDVAGLGGGTHTGQITIDAPGALNSPAFVDVMLTIEIIGELRVTTNSQDATFTINGPNNAVYTGSGMSWSKTGVEDGDYTIEYGAIAGHIAPPSETLSVINGSTVNFAGNYTDLRREVNIIASHGPWSQINGTVSVFLAYEEDNTPVPVKSFQAFDYTDGATTAVGDVNGDGSLDIIAGVGPNNKAPAEVKAFNSDGTEIGGLEYKAHESKFGAEVATGDFDGDGRDEIIASQRKNANGVMIHTFEDGVVKETGISFEAFPGLQTGARIASGDLDGDGVPELLTSPETDDEFTPLAPVVNIYRVDTSQGLGSWTVQILGSIAACDEVGGSNIATGDTDADGISEVLVVCPSSLGTEVRIFTMDGTLVGSFATGSTRKDYIAAGDTNMDGIAEIIIGDGPANHNQTVKIFDVQGTLLRSFQAFDDSFGVCVSVGDLGYRGGAQ